MLFAGRWWGCVSAAASLGFSSLASPLTQSSLPTPVGAAPVLGLSVLPLRPPLSCFWTCLLSLHRALCEAFSPTGSRAESPLQCLRVATPSEQGLSPTFMPLCVPPSPSPQLQ